MAGHGFKALQTFRGWSKEKNDFVYGSLISNPYWPSFPQIIEFCDDGVGEHTFYADPKSIGIYTGKDDATRWEDRPDWLKRISKEDWTGVPIFAGLPEDGNIGGDNVIFNVIQEDEKIIGEFVHKACNYFIHANGKMYYANSAKNIEVIGTAYEQHLEEKKNV